MAAFEQLFRERGMPIAIRSDNGVPFASPNALFNLSKLSVVAPTWHCHRTHQAVVQRITTDRGKNLWYTSKSLRG
jgi:hypothetical protein